MARKTEAERIAREALVKLEDELIGEVGHRGGKLAARASLVCDALGIPEEVAEQLPLNIGVYCNYLGGGIRGAVAASASVADFSRHGVPHEYIPLLVAFMDECRNRYVAIESEQFGDGSDPDDWDGRATLAARAAGMVSAY